jgi:hypothetical protein
MLKNAARFHQEHLYEELWAEATWLTQCWQMFEQLYANRDHVQTMRETALLFFGMHQKLLQEAIFLYIQRLLDPSSRKRGREKTASLETLCLTLNDTPEHAALNRRLRKSLGELRKTCTDIEAWRHQLIAHLDYSTAMLERRPKDVKVRTVKYAVEHITEFLQDFEQHVYGHTTPMKTEPGGGDTLMVLLKSGRDVE